MLLFTVTLTCRVVPTGTGEADGGAITWMAFGDTDLTGALLAPNVTETGAWKPPPEMVTTVPPAGSPVFGASEVTEKVPGEPMETVAAPGLKTPVGHPDGRGVSVHAVAPTVAVPALVPGNSTAWACPLTSCRLAVVAPLPTELNSPSVVVSFTGVRFGGGEPSWMLTACTVILLPAVEPMVRWLGLAVTVMLKVVTGGGTLGPIGGPDPPGSVGDFVEQAAAAASAAAIRMR